MEREEEAETRVAQEASLACVGEGDVEFDDWTGTNYESNYWCFFLSLSCHTHTVSGRSLYRAACCSISCA